MYDRQSDWQTISLEPSIGPIRWMLTWIFVKKSDLLMKCYLPSILTLHWQITFLHKNAHSTSWMVLIGCREAGGQKSRLGYKKEGHLFSLDLLTRRLSYTVDCSKPSLNDLLDQFQNSSIIINIIDQSWPDFKCQNFLIFRKFLSNMKIFFISCSYFLRYEFINI